MTTQAAPARNGTLPIGATLRGSHSISWWGTVILILNEAVIFASLLASYFYIRINSVLWPPQGVKLPELVLSGINTLILIGSSLALLWATAGIRQDNGRRLRAGLGFAFVLGAIFLGVQIYEYTRLKFLPQAHAYGSLFWSITGLHAVHVLAGLLMIAYVELRAFLGHFNGQRHQAVENVSLYWHFVDVVWILIFASLFISPYL